MGLLDRRPGVGRGCDLVGIHDVVLDELRIRVEGGRRHADVRSPPLHDVRFANRHRRIPEQVRRGVIAVEGESTRVRLPAAALVQQKPGVHHVQAVSRDVPVQLVDESSGHDVTLQTGDTLQFVPPIHVDPRVVFGPVRIERVHVLARIGVTVGEDDDVIVGGLVVDDVLQREGRDAEIPRRVRFEDDYVLPTLIPRVLPLVQVREHAPDVMRNAKEALGKSSVCSAARRLQRADVVQRADVSFVLRVGFK